MDWMSCWSSCWRLLSRQEIQNGTVVEELYLDRAAFEEIVTFMSSVPLFKNQLPRSELPKVAMKLKRKEWAVGRDIVKQGDLGKAFYLIMSGEASVLTAGPEEGEHVRAVLRKGDYFGGRTLLEDRNNVATIRAHGKETLVTLSMSRKAFHDSGIQQHLRFPKRAAIHTEHPTACAQSEIAKGEKSAEEVTFIAQAVRRNTNLRALLQVTEEQLETIARAAERRIVQKGQEVVRCGEVGDEFFIIYKGSFGIIISCPSSRSAEETVAMSSMSERLLRKQTFLQRLSQPSLCGAFGRAHSTLLTPKQKEELPESTMFLRGVSGPSEAMRPSLQSPLLPPRRRSPRGARYGDDTSPTDRFPCSQIKENESPKVDPEEGFSDQDSTASTSPSSRRHEILTSGESFGELALLYNMRREATFRAREDSVVYVVRRQAWETCFTRRGQRFDEYCALLDEVNALEPLLSSERWELACNATGFVHFKPWERVLTQGKVRQARQWYVIYGGSAVMKLDREDGSCQQLAEVFRPGCFGERSLLRGIYTESPGFIPDIYADVEEWCQLKARRRVNSEANQLGPSNAKDSLEKFAKLGLLGRGAYGEVLLVEDTVRKKPYALKVMSKGHIQRKGVVRQVRWERELLSMVDSPFVIRLHRTLSDNQHIFFLMEAALGGNLMELLHTHSEVFMEDRPRGSAAAFYVACIVLALAHLHERFIVHRDVKPENAMLDERGYAKLCDMGFARFVLNKTNTLAGTPEYMAPEIIDYPHTHDRAVDWWALGVLTYELLSGQTPFYDEGMAEPAAQALAIRRSQEEAFTEGFFFPFHFPSIARNFVRDLLTKCPERRCEVAQGLQEHSMYRQMDFSFAELRQRTLHSPFCPEVSIPEANTKQPASFSLENDPELYRPVDNFREDSFV
ncbi:unnamed protein product [Effrenium voratum]|uniref:cGMP-dependent protein kinase n=1 Tax=Effrenium voratum TaxID=2562239 RepID=A0AA36II16_9DINO|nr:unnamed protein product [Effrenium voratum]